MDTVFDEKKNFVLEDRATVPVRGVWIQNAIAGCLALFYVLQICFFQISDYTGLPHPSWWIALPTVCLSGLIALCRPSCFRQSITPTFPDYIFYLFISYVLLREALGGVQSFYVWSMVASAALLYGVGKLTGYLAPRAFFKILIVMSVLVFAGCIPVIFTNAANTVDVERLMLPIGIVAAQWPGFMVGALAVASFGCALLVSRKSLAFGLSIASGFLVWFLLYSGARSVLFSAMLAMLLLTPLATARSLKTRFVFLAVTYAIMGLGLTIVPAQRIEFFAGVPRMIVEKPHLTFQEISPEEKEKTVVPKAVEAQKNSGAVQQKCVVKSNSIGIRKIMYGDALFAFLRHPLEGVGVGNFKYFSCVYAGATFVANPHSILLHVASELGLPGLVLFVTLIVWIAVKSITALRAGDQAPAHKLLLMPLFGIWLFHLLNDQVTTGYMDCLQYYIISGILVGYHARFRKPMAMKPDALNVKTLESVA